MLIVIISFCFLFLRLRIYIHTHIYLDVVNIIKDLESMKYECYLGLVNTLFCK